MLLRRQEIVDLLLENGDIGTAKMVQLKLPQQVNTRRDHELLTQLGVNIEYLPEERIGADGHIWLAIRSHR